MNRLLLSLLSGVLPVAGILLFLDRKMGEPTIEAVVPKVLSVVAPEVKVDFQSAPETFLQSLGDCDADRSINLLKQVEGMDEGEEKTRRRQMVFDRLAECDRERALEIAEEMWTEEKRLYLITPVIAKWAHEEPDAAWEWVDAQNAEALSKKTKTKWAWGRLLEAVYKTRSFCEPTETEVTRTWVALERYFRRRGEGKGGSFHNGVFRTNSWPASSATTDAPMGSLWTLTNHARKTGGWTGIIERLISVEGISSMTLVQVSHNWMAADMEAALSWANRIADPKKKALVFESMIPTQMPDPLVAVPLDGDRYFSWLTKNAPDEAAKQIRRHQVKGADWLASVPANASEYDGARASLSFSLVERDVDTAIAWAKSVVDERWRKGALSSIVREWSKEAPRAAKQFAMDELGWSAERCAKLLK